MRPLKIALIATRYWEEATARPEEEPDGGATQQLAQAVAALGHEVVVLTQSPDVGSLKKINLGSLETWAWPQKRRAGLFAAMRDRMARKSHDHPRIYTDARFVKEFFKKRGPFDVAWAPNEMPDGLIVAKAAELGADLPPVLTQVQAVRMRFKKKEPTYIHKTALRKVFRKSTRLVAASDMLADAMVEYAGGGLKLDALREKTRVVHPHLRKDFAYAAFDRSLLGPWPDRVLYLGEADTQGGVLVFMKAILHMAVAQRSSTFVVTGNPQKVDGKGFPRRWEKAQEGLAAHLAAARTEYIGHVSTFEIIRQIKLASVVVIPALFSPFSRALVEAIALGRPVITTDRVGAWGIVQNYECGLVIDSYDSSALAHAVDQVLAPGSPYATNAQRIAEQMIQDFSAETIASDLMPHFSEIARK